MEINTIFSAKEAAEDRAAAAAVAAVAAATVAAVAEEWKEGEDQLGYSRRGRERRRGR